MADWTAINLRDDVLEYLTVKAAGQSAAAADATLVDNAVTRIHAELRSKGLAPFAVNAIPDWAKSSMRDYVAADVAPYYGLGAKYSSGKITAENSLIEHCSSEKPKIRTKAVYY